MEGDDHDGMDFGTQQIQMDQLLRDEPLETEEGVTTEGEERVPPAAAASNGRVNSKGEERPVPECTVKMLITNTMAGSLIGKGGATIQEIQGQSSAMVRVSTSGMYFPGTQDRVVLVAGDTKAVKMACALILHTVHQVDRDKDVDAPAPLELGEDTTLEITQRLLIPSAAGGLIIGRGGANIKALSEASQAKVNLSQKQGAVSNERIVTMQGGLAAVINAAEMVVDKLREDPHIARYSNNSVNYKHAHGVSSGGSGTMHGHHHHSQTSQQHPGQQHSGQQHAPPHGQMQSMHGLGFPHPPPGPMPPFHGLGGELFSMEPPTNPVAAAVAACQPTTTIAVGIPDNLIGAILGKGGSTIMELQNQSGARITVSQRGDYMPGTDNRTVTIKGAPLAAQTAQFLITQKIQATTTSNERHGGGRGEVS
ncbi:unnamed protein product [Choristocarpus tenellus]